MTNPSSQSEDSSESRAALYWSLAAALVTIFIVAEYILRTQNPGLLYEARREQFQRRLAAEIGIRLEEPPSFVTNADGIWTANPTIAGINTDGYRSPEFTNAPDNVKKLLFLGGDMTWGSNAEPLTKSYTDLVRQSGYTVHNLGIPGADSPQFVAQAKKYIPQLAPDAVVVMFSTGNGFEFGPDVRPGLQRYHSTNLGPIPACEPDGTPIPFEEAAQRFRGETLSFFKVMLSKSALYQYFMTAADIEIEYSARVATVLEQLKEIKALSEASGAKFMLILVPTREEYANERNSLAHCVAQLKSLSPLAPPGFKSSHFGLMPYPHFDNTGHALMAEYLLINLAAAGIDRSEAASLPAAVLATRKISSMRQLKDDWHFSETQAKEVETILNQLKDDVARIYFEPPADGTTSPGDYLASVEDMNAPEVQEHFEHMANSLHPKDMEISYAKAVEQALEATIENIGAVLLPEQRQLLFEIGNDTILTIDTGYNPFGDRLGESIGQRFKPVDKVDRLAWEEVPAILQLDPQQADDIRAIVNALKQDFLEIMARKTDSDGESPLIYTARKLMAPPNEQKNFQDDYAGVNRPSGSDKSYNDLIIEAQQNRLKELDAILTPIQHARMPTLPVDSLLKIDTGHDPFGAAVVKEMAKLNQPDTSDQPGTWDHFRSSLALNEEQAQKALVQINALKDTVFEIFSRHPTPDLPAPRDVLRKAIKDSPQNIGQTLLDFTSKHNDPATGKPYTQSMHDAELACRKEIYKLLKPNQLRAFNEFTCCPYSEIKTGYDPLGDYINTPTDASSTGATKP